MRIVGVGLDDFLMMVTGIDPDEDFYEHRCYELAQNGFCDPPHKGNLGS